MKLQRASSALLALLVSVVAGASSGHGQQSFSGHGHGVASVVNELHRPVRFDHHKLVRFQDASRALPLLQQLCGEDLDVWGNDVDEERGRMAIDVRLSTEQFQRWSEHPLAMSTVSFSVVDANVQDAIDQETQRLKSHKVAASHSKGWFEEYHRFEEIRNW